MNASMFGCSCVLGVWKKPWKTSFYGRVYGVATMSIVSSHSIQSVDDTSHFIWLRMNSDSNNNINDDNNDDNDKNNTNKLAIHSHQFNIDPA